MKKMKVMALVVMVAIVSYGVYTNQKGDTQSDLFLLNLEALARYELPEIEVVCEGTKNQGDGGCWVTGDDCYLSWVLKASDCEFSGYMEDHCLTPCDD